MKSSDQGGNHMAVFRVIIVARPIQIGRHHRNEIAAVLAAVSLAKLDASDLCNGIPFVRGLKFAGEHLIFAHRLLSKFWVNATRSEKQEFLHVDEVASVNAIERHG